MTNLREIFEESFADDHGSAPAYRWEICHICDGHGSSARHLGGYTQADREEMGDEWYEFHADVRAGRYDQVCDECRGSGKVKGYTGEAKAEFAEWVNEAAADRHTQRMESGGY